MRILGIETSGFGSQVALAEDGSLVSHWEDTGRRRHARELVPGIGRLLAEASWQPRDLDLVAVSIGPGSYTGLRVGVTCAKTFAYAAKLQALGIATPETIALNAPDEAQRVAVILDAQRGGVYATEFHRDAGGTLHEGGEGTVIVPAERWAKDLQSGTYVLGPALARHHDLVSADCRVGPEQQWEPRVEVLIQLARRDYQAGRRMDLNELLPLYLRKSAAEEKWDQRNHDA